ncbi:MAG: cysteine desulfurase family protein [Patescibacteria group bacterium]
MKNVSKLLYFDHAAISPVRPEVLQELERVSQEAWGNPSSLHGVGRTAKAVLDNSREVLTHTLFGARPGQVIFTSGGTEGNNLVLRGVVEAKGVKGVHIISQPTEHTSVLEVLRALEQEGAEVTWLPVDEFGLVNVDDLKRAVRPNTALISIMSANNEIGTVQPIKTLAEAAKADAPTAVFHTDACQTAGWLNLKDLGPLDAITITGTKFGGPRAGAVWVRRGLRLEPLQLGGGQESGLRSGTEAVPEIAGLAKAVELAGQERENRTRQLIIWRDQLIRAFLELPQSRLNGHATQRLPQNVHLSFAGVSGETLLVALDQAGLAASTGSACAAGSIGESHVFKAIGLPKRYIRGSLRLTLGWSTTEQEVKAGLKLIPKVIKDLRTKP